MHRAGLEGLETRQGVPAASKHCSVSPETPGTEHSAHTFLPAHFSHSPRTELWLFPLPGRTRRSRRVSQRPLPKSSVWGWVTQTQHKGMRLRLGQEEASNGAGAGELRARSRAGWGKPQQPRAVCEAAGHGGSLRDVPVVEDRLSPQPPPRAVAGAAAALPQRRPGHSRCNHGLINALGNFTVCSWHCSS